MDSNMTDSAPPSPIYRFEWDSHKERSNILKHDGVTFRLASTVLHDPHARPISKSATAMSTCPARGPLTQEYAKQDYF
jgi:hypothetical protein